ncbi:hypothetical protein ACQWE9_24650, partial [Salmonella enterica subsp. enterica serovar Infantis]
GGRRWRPSNKAKSTTVVPVQHNKTMLTGFLFFAPTPKTSYEKDKIHNIKHLNCYFTTIP